MPRGIPKQGFRLTKKRVQSIQQVRRLVQEISNQASPVETDSKQDLIEYAATQVISKPEKPKKGRPKNVYQDPDDRPIHVQFMASKKERDLWEKMAENEGLPSLSSFLLAAIRDGVILRTPSEAA